MKEQNKATVRELYETDTSNMPDKEFVTIIIRIPTGLEKKMEDMSKNLNKEIRSNIVEMGAQ